LSADGHTVRVTRAFVASVGAGLCLIAAAVVALFVVSAVVAVRGWPGIDPENDVPRVTLADGRALGDADAGGPVAVTATAGTTPIVLGGAGTPGATTRTRGDRVDRSGPGSAPVSQPSLPATPGAPAPAGQPQPSAGADRPASTSNAPAPATGDGGDTGRPAPATPGSTVTQVTDGVADTVQGVGNTVGGPVQQTTERAGEAVRNTGSAVDSATQGDVAGAVDSVGKAVDGLLGGKQ
jgi:hypothetical protein